MPEQEQTTTQAPTAANEQQGQEQNQGASSAETKNTDTSASEPMIPKARFDEVNQRLRKLEQEQAKQEQERAKAEEDRLKQQQQWEQLATQREQRIAELQPKVELADKLSAMVLEQYEAEIKEWPEEVRNMAPDDSADVLTKLAWKERAKPLALSLMADKTPTPGNGPRPKPAASAGSGQQIERARAEQATWTRRNF